MNIVLVNPPPLHRIEIYDTPDYPHLGLGYIAAALKESKKGITVIDAKLERIGLDRVVERLHRLEPDIIGLTAMTHEIGQAHKVAQIVKETLPQTVTVIGGIHATALPYETLSDFPGFDIVVFGEGEYTFSELVAAIESKSDFHGIKGMGFREADGIHINEPREPIEDLDGLPFPAWELFPVKGATYHIMATRGCPFRCTFCMRAMGNRVRNRTTQNVVQEIQSDIDIMKARYVIFADETFAIDKKWACQMLHLMRERGINKRIRWEGNTRVDLADYELFKEMKEAGCAWLGFGIESGAADILKATKKGITLAQAENAIELAKKAGLKTGGYFILGHPFETRETAQDTIDFATKLNTTTVAFGIMVPYPKTEIYEMAKEGEGGYKIISTDWADFNKSIGNSLELEGLSRKELEKLQLRGYLKFYLFNFRFLAFLKLFLSQRRLVLAVIRKILTRRGQ